METGDKLLALLGAKVVCCGLLALGAAGLLGGFTAWLIEGTGRWVLAGAVAVLIVWVVLGRRRRGESGANLSSEKLK